MNPLSLGLRTQILGVGGGSGPKTLILRPCRRKNNESFELGGANSFFERLKGVGAENAYFETLQTEKL